jgi:hypothetical protein
MAVHKPAKIAIVGNGPLSRRDARHIDSHDLVIRFNQAPHYRRGQRVDVLVLRSPEVPELRPKKTNWDALRDAGEIWLRTLGPQPVKLSRPWRRFIHDSKVRGQFEELGAPSDAVISSGIWVMAHCITHYPQARINIFGFEHTGWDGHIWDHERAWTDDRVREGRLHRCAAPDTPIVAQIEKVRRRAHRLRKSLRRRWDAFMHHVFGRRKSVQG